MKTFCKQCNAELEIPNEYAGKDVECPQCKTPFSVPPLIKPQKKNDKHKTKAMNDKFYVDKYQSNASYFASFFSIKRMVCIIMIMVAIILFVQVYLFIDYLYKANKIENALRYMQY